MADIIGTITNPIAPAVNKPKGYVNLAGGGLTAFLGNVITLLIVIAGIFTLVNFIAAGYIYLASAGEPQKLIQAANKMTQSLIGLAIISGGFIISGLIGYLFFQDATFLFKPIFESLF